MSTYLTLGDFGKKVSTQSAECQLLINNGLLQMYGFNHEEAIRCFKKSLTYDKNCAMAHYFIAYSNAANYNNPAGLDYGAAYKETRLAMEKAKQGNVSEWEMALIKAQQHRFCWPPNSKPLEVLNKNYANKMRLVYRKFGLADADITAFFAESLMVLAPWKLWTPAPEYKPGIPETIELVSVLEKALKVYPNHPALCHFYIHTMELSATPEKALPAADSLRTSAFEQGHLIHMPGHIDMWVGHYCEAIETSKKGIAVDQLYMKETGHDIEFYKMYRMHVYHFAIWAAMFDGQFATAMMYAEESEKQLGPETIAFMAEDVAVGAWYLEPFTCLPWHVLIRFGKWEEIVSRPLKEDKDMYASATTTAHYARAIAFAVTGRLKEADEERIKFYTALHSKALSGRSLLHNVMHDPERHNGILDVAEAVMNGEVEYHKGNVQEAFKYLHLAAHRDANLVYDEPWGWMMPVRHVIGALLVEQGKPTEAEVVYRQDLALYKNNLWSLRGLHQALHQQGKADEAELTLKAFEKASIRSDINPFASCLCTTKLCCSKSARIL